MAALCIDGKLHAKQDQSLTPLNAQLSTSPLSPPMKCPE